MKDNPLRRLGTLGQSIWLDYIRRDLIVSGELRRLIVDDGLRGMTSNPSIFEKAIAGRHDYDEDIRVMGLEGKSVNAIYEALSQRLLWASTSTKNPEYSDVKYIESLIGRDTVNTAPIETLDDYRDHGEPKDRIEHETVNARRMLDRLPELDISIDKVTQQLENEGVEKFSKSFDKLMETLEKAVQK
ncbi:MAG: hypothetical protein HS132_03855 [Planctomycetia bacterium]|nr:hypothetical protein [Planctomycetia bacterium]